MKADSVNDTNISEWTPIVDARSPKPGGMVSPSEPTVPTWQSGSGPFAVDAVVPARTVNHATNWQPAETGPEGYPSQASALPNGQPEPRAFADGGLNQWRPANQPGYLTSTNAWLSSAPVVALPGADTPVGSISDDEDVRHGGPFSRNAWRWSLIAVTAIIGIVVLVEMGLSRLIDQYESGTVQRLAIVCASLFTNDVVIIGVLIISLKRMGMSFRSLGIRRPADVKESIVLAFSAWLIFIFIAGVWALVSQSAAEREANNPFLKDNAVNARDSVAKKSTSMGSDSQLGGTPSAKETTGKQTTGKETTPSQTESATGNESATGTESGFSEVTETTQPSTNKRTDQLTKSTTKDVADNRHVLMKVLGDDPPKALLLSILITGCIGAPLLEELLVRGFLFGAFSQRFGKLAGGAISSLLFGFAHIMAYPLKMIPPLVVMGAALAWLAWHTGSIVPGIFIHAFVNSLGLGISASLGGHVFTLLVASWLVLALMLFPWIRTKPPTLLDPR
jgi:hypothetical protein